MSLPAEILDHILSFLQSDTSTLQTCSLSHPLLSHLVERHLYANVTLHNIYPAQFDEVLRDRPHVANYVRSLKIRFSNFGYDTKPFLEKISFILPEFSKIKRIELIHTGYPKFRWYKLPEKFRLAFLDCLRLPSLTDISTRAITFPLSILSHCKHIRYLSLRLWDEDRTASMEGSDKTRLPTIDSLALHNCNPDSLSTVTSWIQPCHLSSLEFSDAFDDVGLHQVLICCPHSLTSLDLEITEKYGSFYDSNRSNIAIHPKKAIPIPLSILHNLQQLTMRGRLYRIKSSSGTWEFSSPIFAIAQVLKSASPFNRLILDLVSLFEFHSYEDAQDRIEDVLCRPLHSLLVQSASTIGSIRLQLSSILLGIGISVSSEAIISILAGNSELMGFVERGKLILVPVDWPPVMNL